MSILVSTIHILNYFKYEYDSPYYKGTKTDLYLISKKELISGEYYMWLVNDKHDYSIEVDSVTYNNYNKNDKIPSLIITKTLLWNY
jgi:hypothetical protein